MKIVKSGIESGSECLLPLIPNFFHIMYPKVEKVSLLDTEYFDNFV